MRLKVFDTIDEALALLSENNEFYHEIEREIEQYLIAVFKESSEMIIDINSRVKSRESLREKIIRNRFYVENDSAQGILAMLTGVDTSDSTLMGAIRKMGSSRPFKIGRAHV